MKTNKITTKQISILHIINSNGLRIDKNGRKYYLCPTSLRRRGEMIVGAKELLVMRKSGWLDENDKITQLGLNQINPDHAAHTNTSKER